MKDLFEDQIPRAEEIPLVDANLRFFSKFLARSDASRYFECFMGSTPWQDKEVVVWGKRYLQPRLVAWFGEQGTSYSYSGTTLIPHPWSPRLLELRRRVQEYLCSEFNSVLLNLYRNERDRMGWHSDDEPELGAHPVIASLSLGAPRVFQLKHKYRPELGVRSFELPPGSLFVMSGETQRFWLHSIRKEVKPTAPRINLTFRQIQIIRGKPNEVL